ncbi:MAG: hypothetical protein ACI8RD_013390 [Bacillariaceae sp.]|jgi:hypothetical protein
MAPQATDENGATIKRVGSMGNISVTGANISAKVARDYHVRKSTLIGYVYINMK